MIARKGCQPLLRLAHTENLIHKVPCQSSELFPYLSLHNVHPMGYPPNTVSQQRRSRQWTSTGLSTAAITYEPIVTTFNIGNVTNKLSRPASASRVDVGSTQVLLTPVSADRDGRKYIDCFPYISPQDNLLRVWDVDAKCDVVMSVNKGTLTGQRSEGAEDGRTMTTGRGRIAWSSFMQTM